MKWNTRHIIPRLEASLQHQPIKKSRGRPLISLCTQWVIKYTDLILRNQYVRGRLIGLFLQLFMDWIRIQHKHSPAVGGDD